MVGVVAVVALASVVVHVEGDATCPQPDAVAQRLASLVPAAGEDEHLAQIDATDEGLRIELRQRDGVLIHSRVIPVGESCEALADTVAAMIAAWESSLTAPLPTAAPTLPLRVPPADDSIKPFTAEPTQSELGVGFLASVAGGVFAPGGIVDVVIAPSRWPVGLRFVASGADTRDQPLAMGHASWTRVALGAGPDYRRSWHALVLDAHAEASLGFLSISGSGYRTSFSDTGADAALGGGLRIGRRWGGVTPWIDASFETWLRGQDIVVTHPDATSSLPRLEVQLSAGVSFFR